MSVMELARFVGASACQLLSVNRCNEAEFNQMVAEGKEIILPVATAVMVRKMPKRYKKTQANRIVFTD